MAFTKATKERAYLRLGLYGPSGSGKTYTALRLGSRLAVRAKSELAVICTERGSARKYSDRFAFLVDDLEDRSIEGYIRSMHDAAAAGIRVLVVDSLTHAWQDLLGDVDRQKAKAKDKFGVWAVATPRQKQLIDAILGFPGHLIATMRANTDWVIGEQNKRERVGLKPEQGKGIEYEFDMLGEIDTAHNMLIIKDRTGKFQDCTVDKPGEPFADELFDWLMDATPSAAAPAGPWWPRYLERARKNWADKIKADPLLMAVTVQGLPLSPLALALSVHEAAGEKGLSVAEIGCEEDEQPDEALVVAAFADAPVDELKALATAEILRAAERAKHKVAPVAQAAGGTDDDGDPADGPLG